MPVPRPQPAGPPQRVDLTLLAVVAGLGFLAVPLVSGVSPGLGDALGAGVALFAVIPIAARVRQQRALTAAVVALAAAYLASSLDSQLEASQGLRHTTSTAAAGAAVLLFAMYGRNMIALRSFRVAALTLAGLGVLAANFAGLDKNAEGGVIAYLAAFIMVVLIYTTPRSAWFYAAAFFFITAALAFALNFRGLVVYTLVLLLGLLGASRLTRWVFFTLGIVVSVAWVWIVNWYFTNVFTSNLARSISQWVANETGRPATSGRQVLWPAIVNAVHGHEWLGLGAGMLPRDILLTSLSSHSTYMQTYLQLGRVGVLLVVAVPLVLWFRLSAAVDGAGRFGAAVLLMFVVHNSTEVLMFENRLMAAIPAWCAIGLAYSLTPRPVRARAPELTRSVAAGSLTPS